MFCIKLTVSRVVVLVATVTVYQRTCFCRHEEQYFESVEKVRLKEVEE